MGIGIKTVAKWSKELVKAHTVFWNGPVGVYEFKNSAKKTELWLSCQKTVACRRAARTSRQRASNRK
jgi:3-phosphoglycerate kinase